jgi:drug/metabolite transporter (DMT)-like permease
MTPFLLFCVGLVVLVGITQSANTQLAKAAFTSGLGSPIALTWLTTNCGMALALANVLPWFRRTSRHDHEALDRVDAGDDATQRETPTWTSPAHWLRVLGFFVLYMTANLSYQTALQHIDAAIVAAVFATAPAFVCALTYALLPRARATLPAVPVEHEMPETPKVSAGGAIEFPAHGDTPAFTAHHTLQHHRGAGTIKSRQFRRAVAKRPWATDTAAALLAVTGMLLAVHPWSAGTGTAVDYTIVAVASPVAAALYKVLFARAFPDAGPYAVCNVLTQIGLYNIVLGTPVLFVVRAALLHADKTDAARLLWPDAWHALPWGYIAGCCATSVLFNAAVNYGVTVMPPLYLSIGTVLATALNIVYEAAVQDILPTSVEWGGVVLITFSIITLISAAHMQRAGIGGRLDE